MGASNTKESPTSRSNLYQTLHNKKSSPWAIPFLPTPLRSSLLSTVSCDAPPLAPPPLPTDPSTPLPPPSDDTTPPAPTPLPPNPGPYEQASGASKRLTTLDTHDGFRCDISKQLSPYMVVIHNFWLGTSMIPDGQTKSYSFVTQVADESGLFMARLDPQKKSVDGRIHRSLGGGIAMGKVQVVVGSADGGDGSQNDQMLGELDFGGLTWTGNLKYGSMGGGNVFGMNYYQSVTERFAMGGEGMYLAVNGSLLNSYTMRYETVAPSGLEDEQDNSTNKGKDAIAAAAAAMDPASSIGNRPSSWFLGNYNAAQGQLGMHYKRVVTPNRVTLGAELSCSPFTLESQVVFGAEFQLTRSKVALAVDGGGKLQTVLETKLGMAPGSPSLSFSAEVDHANDAMKFGYGLNIGG